MNARARPVERTRAFTLIEVLIAIVVVAIAVTILTSVAVSVLRIGSSTNVRSQSAQVLSYFGRQVAGGGAQVLPSLGTTRSWDYGDLAGAFPDLRDGPGVSDLDAYRASVTSDGEVSYVGATAVRYTIVVCTTPRGDESCVEAVTFGPEPSPSGTTPPLLPGIN